jgi:NAD+ diphosphatase
MKPTLGASTLLDRLSHRRRDAAFLDDVRASSAARFLVLVGLKPVILSNDARDRAEIRWFTGAEFDDLDLPRADALFLGVDRTTGAGHFALAMTEHRANRVPRATEVLRPLVDLRTLATQGIMAPEEAALVGKARALAAWHDTTRCCGHCGGATTIKDGGWKRKCWACGQEWFPRIDPVVIMLVTDGERCVLAREVRFPEQMYSAIAGYIEPGEDVEHAVRRETFEEVGLEVDEVRFVTTQPWPFPHTLMIGCIALTRAETTRTGPLKLDPQELADGRWFGRAEVRQMLDGSHPDGMWVPGRQAIAHTLIRAWVEKLPVAMPDETAAR